MYRGRKSPDRANARDVQYGACPLANHLFVERLRDSEEAVYVRVDNPIPRAVSSGGKVVSLVDGGIINKDLDGVPLVVDLAGDAFHPDSISHRDLERKTFSAKRFYLRLYLLGKVFAGMVIKSDVRTLASENLTQCRSDPASPARNECVLSFE